MFRNEITAPAQNLSAYLAPNSLVVVGSAVYVSAADTADLASAVDRTKLPVIGFIRARIDAGNIIVQSDGELSGFAGLHSGNTYFLDVNAGQITDDVSAFSIGNVIQRIGYAKNSTTLIIEVDRDFVLL